MNQARHSGVWILAEQSAGHVEPVSFELLARGTALAERRGAELTAVILAGRLSDRELGELIARGADRVIAVESPQLEHFLLEPYAACLGELIARDRPEILIAAATTTGRTLMPYVAVKAGAGLTADCTELDIEPGTGNLLQTRPAIGGNILATIKTPRRRPQMATVRPHSTRPAPYRACPYRAGPYQAGSDRTGPHRSDGTGRIERFSPAVSMLAGGVRRVGFVPIDEQRTIEDAEAVVVVGRGISKPGNLPLARSLAKALGAAIGATREVVDRGWLSYSHQVGLSGKTISPRLYVGVGVSGSVQHLAGMQTAETIVAINNDPDAQIFKVADFGIVADLFEVVPALTEALGRRRTGGQQNAG